jgi:hypothetical protein
MDIQSNGTGTAISFAFPLPEALPPTQEGVAKSIPAAQ